MAIDKEETPTADREVVAIEGLDVTIPALTSWPVIDQKRLAAKFSGCQIEPLAPNTAVIVAAARPKVEKVWTAPAGTLIG